MSVMEPTFGASDRLVTLVDCLARDAVSNADCDGRISDHEISELRYRGALLQAIAGLEALVADREAEHANVVVNGSRVRPQHDLDAARLGRALFLRQVTARRRVARIA